MKALVTFVRIIVGVLFIFSGFVKMVDPVGFSYKLQEYFGPNVFNLEFLVPYALVIGIILVIFELLLGVMLLLGYAPKFTRWALLILIIFFTFLTFYSAFFDKVKDCGCFGDAIKLTPWQSFYKDLILLLLVLLLFFKSKFLSPLFKFHSSKWIVFVVFIGCLGMTYSSLMHLPAIDFRPYKVGANLQQNMTSQNGEAPKIHDFYIMRDGEIQTDSILNEKKVLFITSYNMKSSAPEGWEAVKKATDQALKKGYDVIGLTASFGETITAIKEKYNLNFEFVSMDATTVKTIIRSNPGLLTLKEGTVTQKAHWNDADELVFK